MSQMSLLIYECNGNGLTLTCNNFEQVIYTHSAQANSAFRQSGVGK